MPERFVLLVGLGSLVTVLTTGLCILRRKSQREHDEFCLRLAPNHPLNHDRRGGELVYCAFHPESPAVIWSTIGEAYVCISCRVEMLRAVIEVEQLSNCPDLEMWERSWKR